MASFTTAITDRTKSVGYNGRGSRSTPFLQLTWTPRRGRGFDSGRCVFFSLHLHLLSRAQFWQILAKVKTRALSKRSVSLLARRRFLNFQHYLNHYVHLSQLSLNTLSNLSLLWRQKKTKAKRKWLFLKAIAEATKDVTDGESSENDIDEDDDGMAMRKIEVKLPS
ncbi:uncharacterized protein LOC108202298 [Daucus carota subsp. sativus]|uniref:uncharacterized protein LOC108202298 n=1 Tax=Daucus carota subsp. sativus TaxID=79200 RepID=UPI003083BA03